MSVLQSWMRSGKIDQRPDPDAPSRRQIRLVTDTAAIAA